MKKLPKINTAKLLKAALPYIFIGLMATKLGQAYRMVPMCWIRLWGHS